MSNVAESFNKKNKETKKSHAESDVKNHSRLQVIREAGLFNNISGTVNIVGLSGAEFMFEKLLDFIGIPFKAISYEHNAKLYPIALKNAPKNVEVRKGSIYQYKYTGEEHIIWFDLMHCITTKSINELLEWICKNQFKHSFTFAFTFVERSPRYGEGLSPVYQKLYPKYKKKGIVDHISEYINESNSVTVSDALVMPYKNFDVGSRTSKMMLYVLKIEKI